MTHDRRAVLEAIAYGDDPELRPGDRLRALELLAVERDEDVPLEKLVWQDTARLSDEDLDAWTDALLSAEFAHGVSSDHFPELTALLQREVERRAREIADPERIEREITDRARTLARELYEQRAFTVVETDPGESGREDDSLHDDDPQFEVFRRVTGEDH